MRLYSTNNKDRFFTLKEAVLKGLPDDNGLFMPEHIPALPNKFIAQLKDYTFQEIAFEIAKTMIGDAIPAADLKEIVERAIDFPAPLVALGDRRYVLELFHGPSLAFKDFGARFMAGLMSYFNRGESKELVVLVATSGDTGGAVAAGFFEVPGVSVVVLYPKGKVSLLQEKQLTTWGGNITALAVDGTFDDCQALVKKAFLDPAFTDVVRLSSANSINIARLIPQIFYYFEAFKQLPDAERPIAFSVPSGNFGNLTAGLMAKKMGLPVHRFIAATNANDVIPIYLKTGHYHPRPSVRTLSNAMDVGAPSNFARMVDLYSSTWNIMMDEIIGYAFNDAQTEAGVKEVLAKYGYLIDPHGAIAYLALKDWQEKNDAAGIILETAHPAKFVEDVERIVQQPVEIPARLEALREKTKTSTEIGIDYEPFKKFLLNRFGGDGL